MKLTDFDKKPVENAQRALKEHYGTNLDVKKLSYAQTRNMLTKVRSLMSESRVQKDFYESQNSPAYLKLVFMEQALSKHFDVLASRRPRIVTENEEVEKSQVVLAAQDLVDSVQKMTEEVSDMLVKELPALVNSIQSEIGVQESETFNQQVTEALTTLQATLTQSKGTLQQALNSITGQGGMLGGDEMGAPADDMGAEPMPGDEMADIDATAELPDGSEEEMDAEIEEPMEPVGSVGRAKR